MNSAALRKKAKIIVRATLDKSDNSVNISMKFNGGIHRGEG